MPSSRLVPFLPAAFLAYLALAFVLRLPSFRSSVEDWDESLYFLMAQQWRAGHLPYTALWDNKPIGIYAIFALFQSVFGDRIAAMRWAAVTAVAATATLVWALVRKLCAQEAGERLAAAGPAAWGAGAAYLLASSAGSGLAANTELFLSPFVCAALLIALGRRLPPELRGLLAGLCLGLGFMVKYVALFEGGAVLMALLWGTELRRVSAMLLAFAAAFAVPLLSACALYALQGEVALFFDASIAANARRVAQPLSLTVGWAALKGVARGEPGLYGAAALALFAAFWRLRPAALERWLGNAAESPKVPILLLIWAAGALLGVAAAKSFFQHYFLQLLPVAAVAGFWLAARLATAAAGRRGQASGAAAAISLVLVLAVLGPALPAAGHLLAGEYRDWRAGMAPMVPDDTPARIAADLAPELAQHPGAPIYVFDYQPILYALLQSPPPTRYAFPSFLLERVLTPVAAIDPLAEFRAIMARQPLFLIRSRLRRPVAERDRLDLYAEFDAQAGKYYRVWRVYDDATVYRRREE